MAQPRVSEFERLERFPDIFDFARLTEALGMAPEETDQLIKGLLNDSELELPKPDPPPPRETRGRSRRGERS